MHRPLEKVQISTEKAEKHDMQEYKGPGSSFRVAPDFVIARQHHTHHSHNRPEERYEKQLNKRAQIMQADAVVHEGAVVVESEAALVAGAAMVGAFGFDLVTLFAERAIVDPDLLVFCKCVL